MNDFRNQFHGFTLLELLIVIAIIGLLASVITVAMNSTREKGKDAAIKAQMSEARKEAELYFARLTKYCVESLTNPPECVFGELNGSTSYCSQDSTVFDDNTTPTPNGIGLFIARANSYAPSGSDPHCFMDVYGSNWTVTIALNEAPDTWWCIDSAGVAKSIIGDYTTIQANISTANMLCP